MESLRGKRAWITGASSGIGRATARALSGVGAEVVLSARRVEQIQALAREISSEGGSAVVKPLDVTDKAASERIGRELAESGGVQILVNNAGVMPLSPLLEDRVDEWEQMIDVNQLPNRPIRRPSMTVIKAAAVQLSPVLYSREGTVDKVVPADPRPRPPGRAVRHLPGDGGAVLPLLLLRAAALPDGRGTPPAARTGGDRAVGRHPGHRRRLQAGGDGRVHRRQRARRRHALQHAAAVRCRRHADPASPQDLPDLSRAHGLGPGRRLRAARRRQRGRAHRLSWRAGSITTRWPATP